MYIASYIIICVYIYIYIEREREREIYTHICTHLYTCFRRNFWGVPKSSATTVPQSSEGAWTQRNDDAWNTFQRSSEGAWILGNDDVWSRKIGRALKAATRFGCVKRHALFFCTILYYIYIAMYIRLYYILLCYHIYIYIYTHICMYLYTYLRRNFWGVPKSSATGSSAELRRRSDHPT